MGPMGSGELNRMFGIDRAANEHSEPIASAKIFRALTRAVSPAMNSCELTHLSRVAIDVALAETQHAAYERALGALGCVVDRIAADSTMPDSVFIEDTAVVLDEIGVLMRPGASSRQPEVDGVREALRAYRMLATIEAPGTMDGGDVLVIGRSVFVGASGRTNAEGIGQFRRHLAPFGYSVTPVLVTGCLHLKSAVTALAEGHVLINPEWLDASLFNQYEQIAVDRAEPHAANVVRVGSTLLYPDAFARTAERLTRAGFEVTTVDVSELAKAEGAVTCCSLVFRG
jgi:dimethylargininase